MKKMKALQQKLPTRAMRIIQKFNSRNKSFIWDNQNKNDKTKKEWEEQNHN